jgi:hypothetical protein
LAFSGCQAAGPAHSPGARTLSSGRAPGPGSLAPLAWRWPGSARGTPRPRIGSRSMVRWPACAGCRAADGERRTTPSRARSARKRVQKMAKISMRNRRLPTPMQTHANMPACNPMRITLPTPLHFCSPGHAGCWTCRVLDMQGCTSAASKPPQAAPCCPPHPATSPRLPAGPAPTPAPPQATSVCPSLGLSFTHPRFDFGCIIIHNI